MGEQAIRIGLIGFGTIGTGVVKLLQRNRARSATARRALSIWCASPTSTRVSDRGVQLARAACWSATRARSLDDPDDRHRDRADGRLRASPAASCLEAIGAGKDVVTANKALLAHHGDEIFRAAEQRGVEVGFEASVGGGIPIIRTLKDGLGGDRNQRRLRHRQRHLELHPEHA